MYSNLQHGNFQRISGKGKLWLSGFVFMLLMFFFPELMFAQFVVHDLKKSGNDTLVVRAMVKDYDTIPYLQLPEVVVFSWLDFSRERDFRRYQRLVHNVKKVYPYARLAGIKLREYEAVLQAAPNDRERRKIMKQAEREIKAQFEGELKELTFSQGKILIKLIDRETRESSYTLLRELRGDVTAFFYQGFARIWGYNLKTKYDAAGEDEMIELIVRMIESGQL